MASVLNTFWKGITGRKSRRINNLSEIKNMDVKGIKDLDPDSISKSLLRSPEYNKLDANKKRILTRKFHIRDVAKQVKRPAKDLELSLSRRRHEENAQVDALMQKINREIAEEKLADLPEAPTHPIVIKKRKGGISKTRRRKK
jgi:hypothetical protein